MSKAEESKQQVKYIEATPGRYLFAQAWEQQSFDCQNWLETQGKDSSRRMVSSMRCAPSKVNGATPTPGDPPETCWPHLIMIEEER